MAVSQISRSSMPPDDWDAVVDGSPDGWCFGLYGWQELILAVGPWGLQDRSFALTENGKTVAVVPLQFNPNNGSLASSGWGSAGPILAADLASKARRRIFNVAVSRCLDIAKNSGASTFEVTLMPVTQTSLNAQWGVNPLVLHGMQDVSELSHVIDLSTSESDLWRGLTPDARRQIGLAREAGYTVERADWAKSLDHYYALHCETYQRTGARPHPRDYFLGIAGQMAPRGHAVLWQVRDIAGAVVGYHNDACFGSAANYHTGCSSTGSGVAGAGYLLFWEALIGARQSGIRWYDCGAIFPNSEDAKQRGLTMFKTKFGGEPHRLFRGRIALNKSNSAQGDGKDSVERLRNGSGQSPQLFRRVLARPIRKLLRAGRAGMASVIGEEESLRVGDAAWRGIYVAAAARSRALGAILRMRRGAWYTIPFMRPYWDSVEFSIGSPDGADRPGDRKRLEAKLRDVAGIADSDVVVLTGSGRSALELLLRVLKERHPERTKVLLPSFGCRGIYDPIIAAGLRPVFIEADRELLPSEPDMIANLDATVLACLVVNTCGKQMALAGIIAAAHRLDISVIEDDCHALGKGPSGYLPDFRLFSFGMGKNAMASAGGALVASSHQAEVRQQASRLAEEPAASPQARFRHFSKRYGTARNARSAGNLDPRYLTQYGNVRMSPRDARLMLSQLDKLGEIVQKRQRNATRIRSALDLRPDIFQVQSAGQHVYTKLTVVLPSQQTAGVFRAHLASWGIDTEEMYYPLHERPFATEFRDRGLPETERLKYCVVNIPTRPNLTEREVELIRQAIAQFCEEFDGP